MDDSARDATQGVGHDVFVSYSRDDQDRVRALVDALAAVGWTVFWDRKVPAGLRWRDYIGNALTRARCVIVVWSQSSIDSPFVAEEADAGLQRDALVPVMIDPVLPPFGFRSVHAADLSRWSGRAGDPAWIGLIEDLERRLGVPPAPPTPQPVAPAPTEPAPAPDPAPSPLPGPAVGPAIPPEEGLATGGTTPSRPQRASGAAEGGAAPAPAPAVAAAGLARRLREPRVLAGAIAAAVAAIAMVLWLNRAPTDPPLDARSDQTPTHPATETTPSNPAGNPSSRPPAGALPPDTPASSATVVPAGPARTEPAPRPAPTRAPATTPLDPRCRDLLDRQQLGETLGTADQQYYKTRCTGL